MVELTNAGREARRQYKRAWRERNREAARDQEVKFWNRKGAEMLAAQGIAESAHNGGTTPESGKDGNT